MYIIQTKTTKGMILGNKQRKDIINRSKPSRRKATMLFNQIEGMFEAEETRGHQIYCRFIRDDNRKQFTKGGHTLEYNRFRWVNRLGISIPSYGAPPRRCKPWHYPSAI